MAIRAYIGQHTGLPFAQRPTVSYCGLLLMSYSITPVCTVKPTVAGT